MNPAPRLLSEAPETLLWLLPTDPPELLRTSRPGVALALKVLQHEADMAQHLRSASPPDKLIASHLIAGSAVSTGDVPGQHQRRIPVGAGQWLPEWQAAQTGPLPTATVIDLALQLVALLTQLHNQAMIHHGLNPQALWIDTANTPPTLRLFDFSQASLLQREFQEVANFVPSAAMLPYLSPEQTGRMNRSVDYRSDFYNLGATLYTLIAGHPPFTSHDPVELIHSHIARLPPSLVALRPGCPQVLQDIVQRLLAKNPEDRYQSLVDLQLDLAQCQAQVQPDGSIPAVLLQRRNFSSAFTMPERLYGRDSEIAAMFKAYDRSHSGGRELLLVAGYSGIGKSALVHEIHKPIAATGGLYVEGKFDQFQRDIPYVAVANACRQLLRSTLSKPEQAMQQVRADLREALGDSAGVLADLLPELRRLLGELPPVAVLGPSETRNRFLGSFVSFIATFANPGHPLALFLDDLQWIDPASLELVQRLLYAEEVKGLLLIGAYRDNEVDATHPVALARLRLVQDGIAVNEVKLGPLLRPTLIELAQECTHARQAEVDGLVTVLMRCTDGNPFYVRQFLFGMASFGLMKVDTSVPCWRWDVEEVNHWGAAADNVLDFLLRQFKQLGTQEQRIIATAACVGNEFDLDTIALAAQIDEPTAQALLRNLVAANFLSYSALRGPAQPGRYNFVHDRVQQASSALLDLAERTQVHLIIGRRLFSTGQHLEERLFEVVDHLNAASALMTDAQETQQLAQLNLTAGLRAKSSIAYNAAVKYLQAGIALIPDAQWAADPTLSFDLHAQCAECYFLALMEQEAITTCEALVKRPLTLAQQIRVCDIQIMIYGASGQYMKAFEVGFAGLRLMNIDLPSPEDVPALESRYEVEFALYQTLFGHRHPDEIGDLPPMTDDNLPQIQFLIANMADLSCISNPPIFRLLITKAFNLSLQFGLNDFTCFYCVPFGLILVRRGEISRGWAIADAGIRLNDTRFHNTYIVAKQMAIYSHHVNHWMQNPITNKEICQRGFEEGLKVHDIAYAAYCRVGLVPSLYFNGHPLDELIAGADEAIAWSRKVNLPFDIAFAATTKMMALCLQGKSKQPLSFSIDDFDEDEFGEAWKSMLIVATNFYAQRLEVMYRFGAYDLAQVQAEATARVLGITGQLTVAQYYLYRALTLMALHGDTEDAAVLAQITESQAFLHNCASAAPRNFMAFQMLFEAEWARTQGRWQEAGTAFDDAIAESDRQGYIHMSALASEKAGDLLAHIGMRAAAQLYWRAAIDKLERWGATGLAQTLRQRYPDALASAAVQPQSNAPGTAATESATPANMDVDAVVQATRALTDELTVERLLSRVLHIVIANAGADAAWLLREHQGALRLAAYYRIDAEVQVLGADQDASTAPPLPQSLLQLAKNAGETLIVDMPHTQSEYAQDPYFATHQPRSVLCLPIQRSGTVVGLLYLENQVARDVFNPARVYLLQAITAQLAISLENAELFLNNRRELAERQRAEQQVRALNATLEQRVEERTQVLASTNVALQAAQHDLAEAGKMAALGGLVAGIAHEINTPVGSGLTGSSHFKYMIDELEIKFRAGELKEPDFELFLSDAKDLSRSIYVSLERAAALVSSFKLIAVDQTHDEYRPFKPKDYINDVVLTLQQVLRRANVAVQIHCDADIIVHSFAGAWSQILSNLITNSVVHGFTPGQANPCATIDVTDTEDELVLAYSDNGKGMNEEVAKKVFDPFFTTNRQGGGSGLGMHVVYNLITQKLQGRIHLRTAPGAGVTFTCSLPKQLTAPSTASASPPQAELAALEHQTPALASVD